MKKILLFVFALAVSVGITRAQDAPYYGTPFYKQGFDSTTIAKTNWVQAGDSAGITNSLLWKPTTPTGANQRFSAADTTSINSASVKFASSTVMNTTLTSPTINMAGKNNVCLGFSLQNTRADIAVSCLVSNNSGIAWDTLLTVSRTSSTPDVINTRYEVQSAAVRTSTGGSFWTAFNVFLPSHYNGQNIIIRFIAQAQNSTNTLYLDGVFLSERRANDAKLLSVKIKEKEILSTDAATYTDGFLREPITVKFKNNGTSAINTIKLAYQLGSNTPVEENVTPSSPLPMGDTISYTFNTPADFSASGNTSVKVFISLANEQNRYDDSTKGAITIQNVTKALPYYASWIKTPPDNWVNDAAVAGGAVWSLQTLGSNYDYILDNSGKSIQANTNLYSAPFSLKAGKKYDIRFSLYTNSTQGTDANAADVYFTDNKNTTAFNASTRIFSKTDITNDSKYRDYFISVTPTKDSIYYVTFNAKSAAGSLPLVLENFQLTESGATNAQLVSLLSPITPKYEYTNTEQVKIRIRNNGTNTINANTLKAFYQLGENTAFVQVVSNSINSDAMIDFTFAQTIDIATLGDKTLKTWIELPGDVATYNDTIISTLSPLITTLPFAGTLPASAAPGTLYNDYWTVVNSNNDAYQWNIGSNWQYGTTAVDLEPEKDFLYTRPIQMVAGQKVKLTYKARCSNSGKGGYLASALFRKVGDSFMKVQDIGSDSLVYATAATAATINKEVIIPSAGVYYFGFYTPKTLLKCTLQLQSVEASSTFERDMMASEILFPSTIVAGLDSLPLAIRVRNVGTASATEFSIMHQVDNGAVKTQAVSTTLAKDQELLVYFTSQPHFRGIGNEILKTWVSYPADEAAYNDTIFTTIQNVPADTIPYSVTTTTKFAEFLNIDNNQDGNRWIPMSGGGFGNFGVGYSYTVNENPANDYLLTRQLKLKADTTYQLKFNAAVDSAKYPADIRILIGKSNHVSDLSEIAFLKGVNATTNGVEHIVYFTPETDTNYTFAFHATGATKTAKIANVNVTKSANKPDVGINILYPKLDQEYSTTDSVVVQLNNSGTVPVAAIPVTCIVNEDTLYAVAYNPNGKLEANSSFTYTFKNVNLYEIGTYNITAYISVNEDVYKDDDTARVTIQSISVLDVALTALLNPTSGTPEGAADVTVKVKNTGKGNISNIPINYSVNGGALVKDTIRTIIAQNEEIEYTFGTKADVSEEKLYSFLIYSTLNDDAVTANDTLRKDIRKSLSPFDLQVSDIVAPFTGRLTNSEKVTIKVKNNSAFSIPDVPVVCKLNNGNILTGNISSIEAGAEIEFTFAGTFNMATFGNYTLTAYTDYSAEGNRANDTLVKIVHCNKLDVGVVELKSPASGYNLGMETITIVVQNMGEEPVDSIPLKYSYNNRNAINGMITAEIAPGNTAEYSFSETEDFSEARTYNFIIFTDLTDDERGNDTLRISVTNMGVGIDEINAEPITLKLYPNPTVNILNVYSTSTIKQLTVYNINGQVVDKVDNVRNMTYQLHVEQYKKGTYIVEIKTDKGFATRKFVVQ